MLDVRVLGPVTVADGHTELVLGGPTATTVLALLATNAPAAVPSSRLVDALWEDDPPRSAHKTLQAHVSKLRRALDHGHGRAAATPVVSAGDGYRLDAEEATTDLVRFRAAVDAATTAAELRSALDIWTGTALGGCLDTRLVEAERTRLREEHLAAIERWATTSIGEGAPEPVVAELEPLVLQHPLREHLWAILVEALTAQGRQGDALATYQRARETLVAQAGLDPGHRLRAAERAALEGVGAEHPGRRHPAARPRRLPAPRRAIIGRSEDLLRLGSLLSSHRLVTVTGPGGSGKTTLATEAARRMSQDLAGRGIFVDLVPATDHDGVARALASACGIRYLEHGADPADVTAGRLADEPTLLVLDNCEHVVDAVADVVDRLLDRVATLTVLATSRQPLEVVGERVVALGPLLPDDAAQLFLDCVAARGAAGAENSDPEAVAEICRVLDGLPLAIELAGARAGHLGVAEVLDGLALRPTALRRHRDVLGRHDSLADTIRWSYDLLDPVEQACLRRLGVFRGPFARDQAVAVVADVAPPDRAVTILGNLVAKSLVTAAASEVTTTFRLLDTIRAFAWDEAIRQGEADATSVRHRDWYLAWAERIPPGASCLRLTAAYQLEPHHKDLLAALETSLEREEAEPLARLAVLGAALLFCPGGQGDAELWIARALDRADELPEPLVADLLGVGTISAAMMAMGETAGRRILAGADLALRHRSGAGPLLFALAVAESSASSAVAEQIDAVREDPTALQEDIHVAIGGMHPVRTFWTGSPGAALAEAEAFWAARAWSDDRTMATWSVHAALLHITGAHERIVERLTEIELSATDGPPTPFLTIFDALALAGTGRPDVAREELRLMRRNHWVRMPAVENDLLVTVAAIADLSGDTDRARRLLDRPDLWSRHPSTGLVHLHHRQRLGLGRQPLFGRTEHDAVSALLDQELGR